MDIGEKESSIPTADVVLERPVEDEAFHDTGLEEQGYVSAPSFSGSDIGLLVDMLAEQATRGAAGPSFENDSSTVPVIGTGSVMIPGISSLPRGDGPGGPATRTDTLMAPGVSRVPEDDGLAGPAVMTDATTVSGTDSLHNNGISPPQPGGTTDLPTGVDIPSMTTSVVISEPADTRLTEPIVRPQSEGTSVGVGSRPSPYDHILAILSDSDPSREVFRMDLNSFVVFFNSMIEKVLRQGYGFDQFRRSLSRYMTMIRDDGYLELADSLTADFIVLESEFRELEELKASGASSFVSSQLEHRLSQWRDLRSSIGSKLQSYEHSVTQLMAGIARKDTDRAELLSSLDSHHEEVDKLRKALKHAEESVVIIAEELAGLEKSREQMLERLGPTQERLMKLKNKAAKILSNSEESIRADLQAELEQSYTDRLSKLESCVLSRRLPSG
ncbi:uncharacterized protein LOC109844279 [Asparagus officinalis]|uniref:uncharacterized protein LOC109844279 n=1 Tax=Asparagus officinalis TaxID=4686 RepID=UPI00098DE7AC|nr:uncharacterized protein LOC109844279 [Asparagus officinalis]